MSDEEVIEDVIDDTTDIVAVNRTPGEDTGSKGSTKAAENSDGCYFGVNADLEVIRQQKKQTTLDFYREVFPKAFITQWNEIVLNHGQSVLIEVNALINIALDNTLIDWSALETLHVVYCLESLLRKLEERNWPKITVGMFASLPIIQQTHPARQLASLIIQQHLVALSELNKIDIRHFESTTDDKWSVFRDQAHPIVVVDLPNEEESSGTIGSTKITIQDVQKTIILDLLLQHVIVVSSELRMTSGGVWGFDLIPASIIKRSKPSSYIKIVENNTIDLIPDSLDSSLTLLADQVISLALANTLAERDNETDQQLARCFVISTVLARSLPLRDRIVSSITISSMLTEFVERVTKQMVKLWPSIVTINGTTTHSDTDAPVVHHDSPLSRVALLDLLDTRFFAVVCQRVYEEQVKEDTFSWSTEYQHMALSLWASVARRHSSSSSLFPLSLTTMIPMVELHTPSQEEGKGEGEESTQRGSSEGVLRPYPNEFIQQMELSDIEDKARELQLLSDTKQQQPLNRSLRTQKDIYNTYDSTKEIIQQEVKARGKLSRWEQRGINKVSTINEKLAQSLQNVAPGIHHIVVARADSISLANPTMTSATPKVPDSDTTESEPDPEPSTSKGKPVRGKGKQPAKPAANKKPAVISHGGKGGKGKKGHVNQKAKILAKTAEKRQNTELEAIESAISFAREEPTVKEKLFRLSYRMKELSKAKQIHPRAVATGLLQLIEWSLLQWQEQCVVMDHDDMEEYSNNNNNASTLLSEFEPVAPGTYRDPTGAVHTVRLIYDCVHLHWDGLEPKDVRRMQQILHIFTFPSAAKEIYQFFIYHKPQWKKEATYVAKKPTRLETALQVHQSFQQFQLEHCGHLMQRSFDSRVDERVSGFLPDAWQRELLDIVDSKQSALVVAPTSSGKTFISYYTMKRVIEANRQSKYLSNAKLVVYVAPTKELVRQVAAEVYIHYGPIVGTYLPAYSHAMENCQVLVTVPDCLEQFLLDPTWNRNVEYCILDEIHCIQEFGTGEQITEGRSIVWEHIINLLPCPFLALSATIGNPEAFRSWLEQSQQRYHRQVKMVNHTHRWSDLLFYRYSPPRKMPVHIRQPDTVLLRRNKDEHAFYLTTLHPLASLGLHQIKEEHSVMFALQLAPQECLLLFQAMQQSATRVGDATATAAVSALEPDRYFSGLILRVQVYQYERELKTLLHQWARDSASTLVAASVIDILTLGSHLTPTATLALQAEEGNPTTTTTTLTQEDKKKEEEATKIIESGGRTQVIQTSNDDEEFHGKASFVSTYFMPLLVELHNTDKLPALVFCLDRQRCNRLISGLVKQLESMERAETLKPEYQRLLREFERNSNKSEKENKRKRDKEEKEAKTAAAAEASSESSVGPTEMPGKDERFSFLRKGEGLQPEEKDFWIIRIAVTSPFLRLLVNGLDRGIGVHHSALPFAYRRAVEVLFRAGHLKVVISTGTLALGINMPCRTVVFAGDSPDLTPMSFQQMKGRAGRRGFDDFGNVVFFGLPKHRVFSLIASQLTDLTGEQPITPTLSLRSLKYFLGFKQDKLDEAATKLRGLLTKSLHATNLNQKEAAIYHTHSRWLYRWYLDYLYQFHLINQDNSLNVSPFANLALQLVDAEPANIILCFSLLSGLINNVCEESKSQASRVELLITVLAHLMNPVPVPKYISSSVSYNRSRGRTTTSMVVLPNLPKKLRRHIQQYNQTVLRDFVGCMRRVYHSQTSASTESETLPFSGLPVGTDALSAQQVSDSKLKQYSGRPVVLRSPFVALSGNYDDFESAQELADTCHASIPIEVDQLPVNSYEDICGRKLSLNAYFADFLKYGKRELIVKENGLKENAAWELIRDWDHIFDVLLSFFNNISGTSTQVAALFEMIGADLKRLFVSFNN